MSQQDVQILQGAYELFNRGDIPAVLNALDTQIEWNEPGGGRAPAGSFQGSQQVADEVFAIIPQHFEEFRAEPEQFIDAGEHIVAVGQFRGNAKSGAPFEAPFAHVWRMRNGKAASFQNYVEATPWAKAWAG